MKITKQQLDKDSESLLKITGPDYSNLKLDDSEKTFNIESKVFDVDFDDILSGYTDKISFIDYVIILFEQELLKGDIFKQKILESRLKYLTFERKKNLFILNTFSSDIVIDKNDTRINCNEDKSTIKKYFMKLNEFTGKDGINPIMSVDDVNRFLCSNFINFSPKGSIVKMEINFTEKGQFIYFIANFYNNEISNNFKNEKKNYINLLINNFTLFDNSTSKSVSSNFARKPKKIFFDL